MGTIQQLDAVGNGGTSSTGFGRIQFSLQRFSAYFGSPWEVGSLRSAPQFRHCERRRALSVPHLPQTRYIALANQRVMRALIPRIATTRRTLRRVSRTTAYLPRRAKRTASRNLRAVE